MLLSTVKIQALKPAGAPATTSSPETLPRRRVRRTQHVKWSFTVLDFAELWGVPEATARRRIQRGFADPTTIEGIARAWIAAQGNPRHGAQG